MSRVRRILRRVTIGSVLLALLAAIAFGVWMVATESGSRFTVAYVSGLVPNLKLRYGGGTMLVLFGLIALGLVSRLTWLAFTLGWRVLG